MYAAILRSVLPDLRTGPLHRVAGYTEVPGGTLRPSGVELDSALASSMFGDYVAACGLTLPRMATTSSTRAAWVHATSQCGDCFP